MGYFTGIALSSTYDVVLPMSRGYCATLGSVLMFEEHRGPHSFQQCPVAPMCTRCQLNASAASIHVLRKPSHRDRCVLWSNNRHETGMNQTRCSTADLAAPRSLIHSPHSTDASNVPHKTTRARLCHLQPLPTCYPLPTVYGERQLEHAHARTHTYIHIQKHIVCCFGCEANRLVRYVEFRRGQTNQHT